MGTTNMASGMATALAGGVAGGMVGGMAAGMAGGMVGGMAGGMSLTGLSVSSGLGSPRPPVALEPWYLPKLFSHGGRSFPVSSGRSDCPRTQAEPVRNLLN